MIYLDNAASTPCLTSVMDAMRDANSTWSNVHRGLHPYAEATTERYEEARNQVADFIKAEPAEIVFTSGTTDAINMVAQGLVQHGDHVLVTQMDHHSNIVPWLHAAGQVGGSVDMVPLVDGELDIDYLRTALERKPKVLAFPAVSNVLGTINPVATICRMADEHDVFTVVDAAQSVQHTPTNVHALDADFLAFSGHKLHGPTGVGVLYVKDFASLRPTRFGGGMVSNVTDDNFTMKRGYQGLEAGTPPIQQAIGLGEACWYWNQLGMEKVYEHVAALTYEAYSRMKAIPGINILGPTGHRRLGIISFTVDGMHPHDVAAYLASQDIAIRAGHHCALPLHRALGIPCSTRVSFSWFNNGDEIDFLILALRGLKGVL
jgi:cysteine desulfurase/selenocysteine lyase